LSPRPPVEPITAVTLVARREGAARSGSAPELDIARRLIAIGSAGNGASSVAEVRKRVANACAGIAGSSHALILGKDPRHSGRLSLGSVVWSAELDEHLASEAVAAIQDRAQATSDFSRLDQFAEDSPAGRILFFPFPDHRLLPGGLALIGDAVSIDEAEREHAALAADQAGMAIRQAILEEEVRHRSTERQLVSRLTRTVVGMQELPDVLGEVAQAVRAITGWDVSTVAPYQREIDSLSIEAIDCGATPVPGVPTLGDRIRLSEWHSLRFALDNCSPYLMSLEQAETLSPHEREHLSYFGISSLLAVPFSVNEEAAGLMLLYSRKTMTLDPGDLRAVQEIGANAALAIQHYRFTLEARLRAEEQSALLRVSNTVNSGKNLNAILAEIGRVSLGFEGVEGCRVLLWHKEEDQFEIGAIQTVRDWQMYYQITDRYAAADWPTCRVVMKENAARGSLISDPDLTARERANHAADQIQGIHTFPIMIGQEAAGVLSLLSRSHRRFGPGTIRVGQKLAHQAAQAIDRARLIGQLQRRAETDGLTGLLNHRAAFEALDRELAAARKLDERLSIIIVDLDDFKFFNDTHGHMTGDLVLVEVATALRESSRARDYVARHGGDEFMLILPGTTREMAQIVAERVLKRMATTSLRIGNLDLPIRVSVGVATYPGNAANRQELIAYGDAAMYSAKECGGGQLGRIDRKTRSLEVTPIGALTGLVRAVDRKDRYTKDHSDMVAEYAVRFGRYRGLSEQEIDALDTAGRLHDIGKIAVPDSILRKPGHLSPEEDALVRQHVVFSELIIRGLPDLAHVQEAVANHHERWDGGGYPYGRTGKQIPLLGRIMAIADALAAMTHDRPYRKGRTFEQALIEIRNGSGTQFDPDLVEDFIAAVSTDTALLSEEARRRRLNPLNIDPDNPPEVVGLTDYLRMRQERLQQPDEALDTA
jgi:diguanylate cyclase (GGDEF)-like protein